MSFLLKKCRNVTWIWIFCGGLRKKEGSPEKLQNDLPEKGKFHKIILKIIFSD